MAKRKRGSDPPIEEPTGSVTIAPQVLSTIVRIAALSAPGVAAMSRKVPGTFNRLLRLGNAGRGVQARIDDGQVSLDLYLVADRDTNLYGVGHHVQTEVARAVRDILGMTVKEIHVHIQDVEGSEGETVE
ncbi:MAG: Asp23/Gls24 family envelope stress response protein [Anaerolineae bacterium]